MIPLAQLIQNHRKKAGLTQAQLAKLAGVGKTVIWDLENGKESARWDTLQKIFGVLSITAEWHSPLLDRVASLAAAPVRSVAVSTSASEHPKGETSVTKS